MVAEGFFIHKRHVHTIHAGASVDVVIDVDIILLLLIVVIATKLRCNGFVLNINNSTSVSRESRKVGEFGKLVRTNLGRLRGRRSQQLFVAVGGGDDRRR